MHYGEILTQMLSKLLRVKISKEFAEEVQGKIYNWELPGIPETKDYPNTNINNLSRNAQKLNFTDAHISLVKAVHGGHYKDIIPEKPNTDTPNGKLLYNAWVTLMKNKTYSYQQKQETLSLLKETLIDMKTPKPLKAKGVMPGQGLKKSLRKNAKNVEK